MKDEWNVQAKWLQITFGLCESQSREINSSYGEWIVSSSPRSTPVPTLYTVSSRKETTHPVSFMNQMDVNVISLKSIESVSSDHS